MLHDLAMQALVAAGEGTGAAAAGAGTAFFDTSLGQALGALLKAGAVLVLIFAAFRAVKDALGGKVGKALQVIIGAAVVAVFMWDPSLISSLLDLFQDLFGLGADSLNELVDTSGTGGTGTVLNN